MKALARNALFAFLLLPSAAGAEPIKLSLAFFSSNQSPTYFVAIKPFVDAVNADASGAVEIDVKFSGILGKDPTRQSRLLLDGTADLAVVVPGYESNQFQDNEVVALPGLFRDVREATLVFSKLVESNTFKGYENYHVIGAYSAEPENIHTHVPVTSLADLQGKRIRTSNGTASAALEAIGMKGIVLPINNITDAITSGMIDGTSAGLPQLFDFGIARVVTYHYLLPVASTQILLLMSRKKFESLPQRAQDILQKYSGQWAATRFVEVYEKYTSQLMEKLKSSPGRVIITPTQADLDMAQSAFSGVIAEWEKKDPSNSILLQRVRIEIANLRPVRG